MSWQLVIVGMGRESRPVGWRGRLGSLSVIRLAMCLLAGSTASAWGDDGARPRRTDSVSNVTNAAFRVERTVTAGTVFAFDEKARGELASVNGVVVVEDFPLPAGEAVDLELERFRITGPATRFVVGHKGGSDAALDFDHQSIVFLRGRVVGVPGSHVFLSFSRWGSTGTVDMGRGSPTYRVSSTGGGGVDLEPGQLIVFPATGQPDPFPAPYCGMETPWKEPPPPAPDSAPILGLTQIELAVETDYEFFSLFGDLTAAGAYVTQLYAQVSDIYIRDVNTRFDLVFVRLWDDPNDLFNEPEPLVPFRDYWNANMGLVVRDVAQFCSGRRDLPWGGIAWLNGLCNTNSYSVAGYTLGFFADPSRPHVFNRDIVITAHELGHNCNTPHTHDLGLDTCNNENSQPQRGSIMSYCGQTFTGGSSNQDPRFHAVTQGIMESYIAARGCVVDDCNQNGIDDDDDITGGFSPDLNANGVPDECEDCNDNGTLDDADISSGFSLDLNGNGVPDECEPDCNGNGVPDDKDITDLTSTDANGNNIPDECEPDCDGDGTMDYSQIQADMSLDLNRNIQLDACEDCDNDGVTDLVALDHAHNIWISSLDHTTLREYLAVLGTLTNVSGNAGIAEGQDLIISSDRRIFISSRLDNRVLEFDASGNYVADFVAPGSGGLAEPAAMAFTPGGNLLVASRGMHAVLEYDGTTGAPIGPFVAAGAGGLTQPFGLAFGAGGNLFVTSNDNQVLEYDGTSGVFLGVFVSLIDNGGLSEPRGLLFLPTTGNLLVASYGTNQVLEFDAGSGTFVRQFNQGGTSNRLTLDQPWGLRIGPEGDVYVSRNHALADGDGPAPLHLTNARIYHFDVNSGFLMRAYILGFNSGVLHPTGFDFMPDAGTDCNVNQFPDDCDISSGFSLDLNANGVPDECEPALGDVNCDGTVDVGDIPLFVQALTDPIAFTGCDIGRADVNGDGGADGDDIPTFVQLLLGN